MTRSQKVLANLDRQIAAACANPSAFSADWWAKRWPAIVDGYADLVDRGVV